jgi:acetolactate synthase-1/2/3 large subunit
MSSDLEAADAIVALLASNGVRELFNMPGDAFPVLEAIARAQAAGTPAPRIVTCLHEIVALAAAHGHHMVSRIPQACLFHVDVGLQMAGGMLHNAQRGHAGVIVLGGRTPATWNGELRGGRVIDMHWVQDRPDLGGTTRDYVKWSYDLTRIEPLAYVIQRAAQIAAAEPAGPVYVSLLREMLLERFTADVTAAARRPVPRPGAPDPAGLEEVADLINAAAQPIAIAGHTGRNPAAFAALADFASTAAVPIYTRAARANLHSDHPMHLGTDHAQALGGADLVLLLDVEVPWTPLFHHLRDDAKVVQIDVDPLKESMGLWSYPIDISLSGDTAVGLAMLSELVKERRTSAQSAAADIRRQATSAQHDAHREALADTVRATERAAPIAVPYLAGCIAELVDEETIVVDDCTTSLAVTSQHIPTLAPGSYFQPMGSSMGWGAGAALGAKLAAPRSTVISVNAEGNFLSGAPEAALWSAARMKAPFLTVVFNNGQYAAIKLGLLHEYPDSALARSGQVLDIANAPDLVALAKACGASAERVDDPGEVRAALRRGLDAVHDGQAAVVDVRVAAP